MVGWPSSHTPAEFVCKQAKHFRKSKEVIFKMKAKKSKLDSYLAAKMHVIKTKKASRATYTLKL